MSLKISDTMSRVAISQENSREANKIEKNEALKANATLEKSSALESTESNPDKSLFIDNDKIDHYRKKIANQTLAILVQDKKIETAASIAEKILEMEKICLLNKL
jgi:50S ribosomal subunit-associated GTPase HflX